MAHAGRRAVPGGAHAARAGGRARPAGGNIFHRDLAWPYAEDGDEPGGWGVETAHPRVLLCGAGARRGGGVSGIPGHNAAMALISGRVAAAR